MMDLPTDFDGEIEEKRRLIEQRESRNKERRQNAMNLVKESYQFFGDDPETVVTHNQILSKPWLNTVLVPVRKEGSAYGYTYTVEYKKTQETDRKVASESVVVTESKPNASKAKLEDSGHRSQWVDVKTQDSTYERTGFSYPLPADISGSSGSHQNRQSPSATYLRALRNFCGSYDNLAATRSQPLPVADGSFYEPSFMTTDQEKRKRSNILKLSQSQEQDNRISRQDSGSKISYLSPAGPIVLQPVLRQTRGNYPGQVTTVSGCPDLPGTPMADQLSLDSYGSSMSSRSVSIDLPYSSPVEFNQWKVHRVGTPFNFQQSTPTPSSSSVDSDDTERSLTTTPQSQSKFKKLCRRVKTSAHRIRNHLRNLLCGTTVQILHVHN